MNELIIYTCIVGPISDELAQCVPTDTLPSNVRCICYTDRARYGTKLGPWEVRAPVWTHPSVPRRTARWHKASAHRLFPDAPVTLWQDGCFQLRVNVETLLAFLARHNMATFSHPERDCIYQEARACARLRKDDPAVLASQVTRYRDEQYPEHNGLAETTCVLRRNTPEIERFNELWWAEMARGSMRDQVSFDYCAWKLRLAYERICGFRQANQYFRFYPHKRV